MFGEVCRTDSSSFLVGAHIKEGDAGDAGWEMLAGDAGDARDGNVGIFTDL